MTIIETELKKKYKIFNMNISLLSIIMFLAVTIFAAISRFAVFPFQSGDYDNFLYKWYTEISNAGGITGIGLAVGDYTPLYIYFLALLSHLPISPLFSIKLLSVVFDFLIAITVFKIVNDEYKNPSIANFAYAVALFAPTMLFNSAFWAQSDAIFGYFCLLSVWFIAKHKPQLSMLMFGIAFCLKLQAIFIAPLLLLFLIKGKIKFRYFFLVPIVYVISILPAFIMGRDFSELLTIYLKQSGEYKALCLNAPNIWYFLKEDTTNALMVLAVMLTGTIMLGAIAYLINKEFKINREIVFSLALFFAIAVPFFLPRMHERYFFLADILSIVYAFYRPKKFFVPILIVFASFFSYLPFLFGHSPIDLRWCVLMMAAALGTVSYDIYKQINFENQDNIYK